MKMDVDDRSAAVRRCKERISAVSRRKLWLAMGVSGGYAPARLRCQLDPLVPWSRDHWHG